VERGADDFEARLEIGQFLEQRSRVLVAHQGAQQLTLPDRALVVLKQRLQGRSFLAIALGPALLGRNRLVPPFPLATR
jgi:hypothetical protein